MVWIKYLILYTNIIVLNKLQTQAKIILIDTDSGVMNSNKINCTNSQLHNKYGHADQMIEIINNIPYDHMVVQDSSGRITKKYVECALTYILQNPHYMAAGMAIGSMKTDPEVYDMIEEIQDQQHILFYIGLHPLRDDFTFNNQSQTIYLENDEYQSASVKVAIELSRLIID